MKTDWGIGDKHGLLATHGLIRFTSYFIWRRCISSIDNQCFTQLRVITGIIKGEINHG